MKSHLFLSIILALLLSMISGQNNVSAQSTSDLKQVAGMYTRSGGFVGANYRINNDGTYEYTTFSDDVSSPRIEESGTYELKDNLLHFKITKSSFGDYNLLDPKEAAEAYRKFYNLNDEEIKARGIKTENELHIVRWGERIYLVKPESLQNFAVAANLGIEPRRVMIMTHFLASDVYLRGGDEKKKVSGNPVLPDKWKPFLLNAPINAIIKKVERQKKAIIYTVNKGSAAGLKVGMGLVGARTKPGYENLVWVISVEKNSAKLQTEQVDFSPGYHIGSALTTKFIKN